ncbi:RnfABCDGE type electron transport complex subunit B [Bengtsoniella intestinalis]|uniref:RnfABCDGE type electron transport complex subunit B n=1 Tax=Bengtsoniella intestinalis TaxID=3073143 RepID=UPI00391F01D5
MTIVFAIIVLAVLGAIFGCALAIASKVFEVETDPRFDQIMDCLPGANCGGCGFTGCAAAANAIVDGKAGVGVCPVGGADCAAKIADVMGVEADASEPHVAFVKCNGGTNAKKKFEYIGVQDCLAATKIGAGPLECNFGCLGFGSCVTACAFGAISIGENGSAVVDASKCTNCMACATACPRKLIVSVPASKKVMVSCANKDKGVTARNVCDNSCIGCGLCVKECKFGAISVVDGVAVIDYSKCKNCKLCSKVCPRDAIFPIATAEEKEKYKAIKKAQAEKAKAAAAEAAAKAAPAAE